MDLESYLLFSILFSLCCGCVKNDVRSELCEAIETARLNTTMLISKRGYPVETHEVITADGYILTLIRILKRSSSAAKSPPVLLVHGISDSSDSWVVLEPKESLAFLLADAGYDVWMTNARGNKYSKKHVKKLSQKQYWDFSYEEMGTEDLPATIDFILQTTKTSQLSYVGYSQGTTIFFVLCSMKPEYNQKIRQAILIAPVAWTGHLTFPFLDFWTTSIDAVYALLTSIGIYDVFPDTPQLNVLNAKVCGRNRMLLYLCQLRHFFILGLSDIRRIPADSRSTFASHIPAGTSSKTFVHFIKAITSKKFQRFDYGKERNQLVYKTVDPPDYDLSLVTTPVSLISSEADWFSDPADVKLLRGKLKSVVNSIKLDAGLGMTHAEFVYGIHAKQLVNYPVLDILDRTT